MYIPWMEKPGRLQFSSVAQSCPTLCDPWTAAPQASLSITNSRSPPKLMSIESIMPSNYLIVCCPLLLLPWIFPSIRVFSNESALHIRWPKYWSFSLNIGPSSEHPGLISFRMDWLDFLAVQGTLKSLLQHYSSKASILQRSAFFIVQLSHPYMTTGKTIALTRWTFVGKVMSLLFNMLSRWVITFLPRSKCLLISLLQSPSALILEPRKIKSATVSTFSPSICHEVMGLDAMILVFWMWSFKPTFSLSSFTFIKRLFSSSMNYSSRAHKELDTSEDWTCMHTLSCILVAVTHECEWSLSPEVTDTVHDIIASVSSVQWVQLHEQLGNNPFWVFSSSLLPLAIQGCYIMILYFFSLVLS